MMVLLHVAGTIGLLVVLWWLLAWVVLWLAVKCMDAVDTIRPKI